MYLTSLLESSIYVETLLLAREIWDLRKKYICSIINGKLMIALLMEKILSRATFPPKEESYEEYLERDETYEALDAV